MAEKRCEWKRQATASEIRQLKLARTTKTVATKSEKGRRRS